MADAVPAEPPAARIEVATSGDLEALVPLAEQATAPPWSRASLAASLAEVGMIALIARSGEGAVLGFALARRAADEAEILLVAVAPGARQRGLGRALVEALLTRVADVRAVHLEVRASNRAAIALYERAGFVATGRRKRYYAAWREAPSPLDHEVAREAPGPLDREGREDALLMSRAR